MKKKQKCPPRRDLHTQVTEQIIERLESGVVPWRQPWNSKVGHPRNFITRKPYQGINILLLGSQGFPSPFWMTFLQAKEAGGRVRRHARGSMIIKYGHSGRNGDKDDDEEKPRRRFMRRYHVFNLSQIDGVEEPEAEAVVQEETTDGIELADEAVKTMPDPPEIIEGESIRAAYSLARDQVSMPPRNLFDTIEDFYLSLFHELVHATGHEKRLDRRSLVDSKRRGDHCYSFEELVAEIGSSMLGAELGIHRDDGEMSVAYIESWLKSLRSKDNRKWIVNASRLATQAVRFIRPQPTTSPA